MYDNKITGKFENNKNLSIIQGNNNNVTQTYSETEIKDLFQNWINEVMNDPRIIDKGVAVKDIEDIKDCVKNNKLDVAKKLFGILGSFIRTSASAVTIAKTFGLLP